MLAFTDADAGVYSGKDCIITEIGRCSHWIRPHWQNAAGTAWPYGYGNDGQGFAYSSLPQFDWSLRWLRDPESGQRQPVSGQPTRRPLVHRIAIPARTARHPQATVHTIWTPGSPKDPKYKWMLIYGFEKSNNAWRLRDTWNRRGN